MQIKWPVKSGVFADFGLVPEIAELSHVEMVVLLSHKKADDFICAKIDYNRLYSR
jgi:hypothetical protein